MINVGEGHLNRFDDEGRRMPPFPLAGLVENLKRRFAGSEMATPRKVRHAVNPPRLPFIGIVHRNGIVFNLDASFHRSVSNHGVVGSVRTSGSVLRKHKDAED